MQEHMASNDYFHHEQILGSIISTQLLEVASAMGVKWRLGTISWAMTTIIATQTRIHPNQTKIPWTVLDMVPMSPGLWPRRTKATLLEVPRTLSALHQKVILCSSV